MALCRLLGVVCVGGGGSGAGGSWAEAPIKIARMILTIKLDGNWNSFQLANSTPPLSVTDSAIAPSARMPGGKVGNFDSKLQKFRCEPHDTTLQLLPSAASSSSFSSSCCWAEALLADGAFTRCCHYCRPPESSKSH